MVPYGKSTFLALYMGENLAVMCFCKVWFLISLGVALWVENDVWRMLGMCWTTRGAGVSVREMGISHCVEQNQHSPRAEAAQQCLGKSAFFAKHKLSRKLKTNLPVNLLILFG